VYRWRGGRAPHDIALWLRPSLPCRARAWQIATPAVFYHRWPEDGSRKIHRNNVEYGGCGTYFACLD
jgi:hypothetical protein